MGTDERGKLKILLEHWIEHNREHSQEFTEWAGRAKAFGEAETGQEILRAAQEMENSRQSLSQALSKLEAE